MDSVINDQEPGPLYSNIIDNVFLTPLKESTSKEVGSLFRRLSSHHPSTLPPPRPRPQLSSTPQPQHVYSNSPTLSVSSPSARNNFPYASRKSFHGRSPSVLSQSSVNRPGLPQGSVQGPYEEERRRIEDESGYIQRRESCRGEDICVI